MPKWLRPRADTIPIVTVCPTPKGLPMASTTSPTFVVSKRPRVIAGKFFKLILMTARSVSGSVPINFAETLRPSAKATSISSADSMT